MSEQLQAWLQTIFSGLIAASIVAALSHWLGARHEKRSRLFDRRLQLYSEVVELIIDNEEALASRGPDGLVAPIEVQRKRISVMHRLRLVGDARIQEAYKQYKSLVFQETEMPRELRPNKMSEVVILRDHLVAAMRSDLERLGM